MSLETTTRTPDHPPSPDAAPSPTGLDPTRLDATGLVARHASAATNPAGIQLVAWPAQQALRAELAAQGVPRLLVVDADHAPPRTSDHREDWIRVPFDLDDLDARLAALVRRADCGTERPLVDGDGLLWFRENWVAIPDVQLAVVRVLLDQLGEVVSIGQLEAAYLEAGGSPNRVATTSMLRRLSSRVSDIGITLHTVRGRGFLIEIPTCRLHPIAPPGSVSNS